MSGAKKMKKSKISTRDERADVVSSSFPLSLSKKEDQICSQFVTSSNKKIMINRNLIESCEIKINQLLFPLNQKSQSFVDFVDSKNCIENVEKNKQTRDVRQEKKQKKEFWIKSWKKIENHFLFLKEKDNFDIFSQEIDDDDKIILKAYEQYLKLK